MRTIIASDFHLKYKPSQEDKLREKRVLNFLKSLKGNTDLLILNGDIFDLWIEWSYVIISDYFPILKVLSDLKDSGCRIIYISGNHDFWFGDFLKKEIGIEIHQDVFNEKVGNHRLYVTHGDLHTVNDLRYHIFRKIIRSSIIKFLVKLIHPSLSLKLGKLLSRSSRNRVYPTELKEKKEKGLLKSAENLLKNNDIVAMGHSHQPKIININSGYYLNSGDWLIHNSYCEIDGESVVLNYFKDLSEI